MKKPLFPWQNLLDWYQEHGRHTLPWRSYASWKKEDIGYKVWVAEIMLQQTQVDRVIFFFHRFLERFPHVQDLATAEWEDFFPYWEWLGYYSRGRNMLKTAQKIVADFWGIFPDTPEQLIGLAGIGPYTARSLCAFAYDKPFLSFDVNLRKIFGRYLLGTKDGNISDEQKYALEKELKDLKLSGRDINNALMDFGSLVSLNGKEKIDFDRYPLPGCRFVQEKGSQEHTKKKDASPLSTKNARIHVVLHRNNVDFFADTKAWRPFILPASLNDHRTCIKDWFLRHYHLKVSVRPSFYKTEQEVWYKAQIQEWVHSFHIFSKKMYRFHDRKILLRKIQNREK